MTLTRNPHPRPRTRTTAPALTNGQVTAVHAGGLAARAGLLVDDRIVEVNSKDTGIETFASLLPKDETRPIRLKIVRMVEVAANEWPTSLLPDGVGSLRAPTQPAAPAAVGTRCVAKFCCPGCGAALRHEFQAGALVGATTCTECSRPLKVRLPPRRPFLSLPAPSAAAGTASSAIAAAATTSRVALPSPPPLDNSFIERVVFYRFPLEGWQRGVVVEQCAPGVEKDDDGDECNFLIYYKADDTEVPTRLAAADYDSREDAPFGSWYVVPGGMGGSGGFSGDSGSGGSPSGQNSRDGAVTTKKMLDKCLDLHEKKEKGKKTRTRRSSGNKWTPEEEAKLKKAKLEVEEKGVSGKWQAIADELGTGRTPSGIQQHWYVMGVHSAGGEVSGGEPEVVDVDEVEPAPQEQEAQEREAEQQIKTQQKTQQRTQQGAAAEQQEAQAAQVMDVTSLVPPPQPERKQTRACELVLIPLGDDAREEVGTESFNILTQTPQPQA